MNISHMSGQKKSHTQLDTRWYVCQCVQCILAYTAQSTQRSSHTFNLSLSRQVICVGVQHACSIYTACGHYLSTDMCGRHMPLCMYCVETIIALNTTTATSRALIMFAFAFGMTWLWEVATRKTRKRQPKRGKIECMIGADHADTRIGDRLNIWHWRWFYRILY